MNLSSKQAWVIFIVLGIGVFMWVRFIIPLRNVPIPRVYPLIGEVRALLPSDIPTRFYQKGWIDLTKYGSPSSFPVLPNKEDVETRGHLLLGSVELHLFVLINEQTAQDYLHRGKTFLAEAVENRTPQATFSSYKLYEEPNLGDENLVYFTYDSRHVLKPDAIEHAMFGKRCRVVWFLNVIDYEPQQSEEIVAIDIAHQIDQKIQESSWCDKE